jgi:predicted transcriptional regulator
MIDFSGRMRRVLAMRKAGMTFEKIGETIGVSRERVRQIVFRAGQVERGRRPPPQWHKLTEEWHKDYLWRYDRGGK